MCPELSVGLVRVATHFSQSCCGLHVQMLKIFGIRMRMAHVTASRCEPESLEGFEILRQPSEPYSPSVASNERLEAESMSSVSDVSNRPEIGREYATSDEERDGRGSQLPSVGEGFGTVLRALY